MAEYLIGQVLQTGSHQFSILRQFFPEAQRQDWREAVAGSAYRSSSLVRTTAANSNSAPKPRKVQNLAVDLQVWLPKSRAFQCFSQSCHRKKSMATVETRLRQELRNYAVELRQLAYTLPNGVGENDFLQLSRRMGAAADQMVPKGT